MKKAEVKTISESLIWIILAAVTIPVVIGIIYMALAPSPDICVRENSRSIISSLKNTIDEMEYTPKEIAVISDSPKCFVVGFDKEYDDSGYEIPTDCSETSCICVCNDYTNKQACLKNKFCQAISYEKIQITTEKNIISSKENSFKIYIKGEDTKVTLALIPFPKQAVPSEDITSSQISIDKLPKTIAKLGDFRVYVQEANQMYLSVPPSLIEAVISAESNADSDAVSYTGAAGLMQIQPDTAKELGLIVPDYGQVSVPGCYLKSGEIISGTINKLIPRCNSCRDKQGNRPYLANCDMDITKDERFDPRKNILAGTKYLSNLLEKEKINGNIELALASYNWGLTRVTNNCCNYGQACNFQSCSNVPQQTKDYVPKVMAYKQNYEIQTA